MLLLLLLLWPAPVAGLLALDGASKVIALGGRSGCGALPRSPACWPLAWGAPCLCESAMCAAPHPFAGGTVSMRLLACPLSVLPLLLCLLLCDLVVGL